MIVTDLLRTQRRVAGEVFGLILPMLKHPQDYLWVGRRMNDHLIYVIVPEWLYDEQADTICDFVRKRGMFAHIQTSMPRGMV